MSKNNVQKTIIQLVSWQYCLWKRWVNVLKKIKNTSHHCHTMLLIQANTSHKFSNFKSYIVCFVNRALTQPNMKKLSTGLFISTNCKSFCLWSSTHIQWHKQVHCNKSMKKKLCKCSGEIYILHILNTSYWIVARQTRRPWIFSAIVICYYVFNFPLESAMYFLFGLNWMWCREWRGQLGDTYCSNCLQTPPM